MYHYFIFLAKISYQGKLLSEISNQRYTSLLLKHRRFVLKVMFSQTEILRSQVNLTKEEDLKITFLSLFHAYVV